MEDNSFAFGGSNGSDFGFSDPGDSPPDNFAGVFITTLPTNGSLTLNGAAVHANDFITAGNVLAGNLKFTPARQRQRDAELRHVHVPGARHRHDDRRRPEHRRLGQHIHVCRDAGQRRPGRHDNTINPAHQRRLLEDSTYSLSAADFGFSGDRTMRPRRHRGERSELAEAVIITTLPTNGTLQLAGGGVNAGDSIPAGQLSQLHLHAGPRKCRRRELCQLHLPGAGQRRHGERRQDLDQTPNTITLNVDAGQRSADRRRTTSSRRPTTQARTFSAADFGFADAADSPANALANVIITVPAASLGTMTLGGVAQTAGTQVTVSKTQLDEQPARPGSVANKFGLPLGSGFTFRVQDNGGELWRHRYEHQRRRDQRERAVGRRLLSDSADATINATLNGTLLEDGHRSLVPGVGLPVHRRERYAAVEGTANACSR